MNSGDSVCAAIVAYYPEPDLADLIRVIALQVGQIIVVDNTPAPHDRLTPDDLQAGTTPCHLVSNRDNLGIARALNQALALAERRGFRWLLTLDQDSHCYPDMVDALLNTAAGCPAPPAVVGSNYYDAKSDRHRTSTLETHCAERKTVITSGSLVEIAFASSVGGFREDFFIDQVDHEFCLRARRHDRRVVICPKPVMDHSVGTDSGPRVPLLGTMLPAHSATRKYYITRNSLVMVANYWRDEPVWCLIRLIRLFGGVGIIIAFEPDKLRKLRAFASGLTDALRQRMGPCPYPWLTQD